VRMRGRHRTLHAPGWRHPRGEVDRAEDLAMGDPGGGREARRRAARRGREGTVPVEVLAASRDPRRAAVVLLGLAASAESLLVDHADADQVRRVELRRQLVSALDEAWDVLRPGERRRWPDNG